MTHLPRSGRAIIACAAAAVTSLAMAGTAVAATAPSLTRPAATARCQSGDLGVWVAADQGNGAAGTIFYPLEFTNLGRHTCSLRGFAGVSAIDAGGHQLGSAAARASGNIFGTTHTVLVAPGATAHAVLAYHDAVVGGALGCQPPRTAAQLRVFPPDRRNATGAFFSLAACAHRGPVFLTVGPVKPGAGSINGL